jgi:hypothetical protein
MPGAVLKVKNLNKVGSVMNAIVDQDGCMHQLADTEPSLDQATNVWEGSEEIDVIQDRVRKLFRSRRKVDPGIV